MRISTLYPLLIFFLADYHYGLSFTLRQAGGSDMDSLVTISRFDQVFDLEL
ncbi:MAG: hypothetical protein HY885_06290 [Deltaproteobacteria bacterium]|nr:hypothetical protein [Deltaproteobacteria bacterium]